jgi:hypothetical protein
MCCARRLLGEACGKRAKVDSSGFVVLNLCVSQAEGRVAGAAGTETHVYPGATATPAQAGGTPQQGAMNGLSPAAF